MIPFEVKRRLSDPGVNAVMRGFKIVRGNVTDEESYVFHVTNKKDIRNLSPEEVIPYEVEGLRTDVVESTPVLLGNPTDTMSYCAPGISIGPEGSGLSGTLGAIVKDENEGVCALTCHHVVYDSGTPYNYIVQPSITDGGVALYRRVGKVFRAVLNTEADAAIFPVSLYTQNVFGTGETLTSARNPVLGETLEKMGRTTRFTMGNVYAEGYININYGVFGVIPMTAFSLIPLSDPTEYIVDHGDSGGVFYKPLTGEGVGHIIAGSWSPTVFCYCTYLTSTLSQLGVSLTLKEETEETQKEVEPSIVSPYSQEGEAVYFSHTISPSSKAYQNFLFVESAYEGMLWGKRSDESVYLPIGTYWNPSCVIGDIEAGSSVEVDIKAIIPSGFSESEFQASVYIGHGNGLVGHLTE